MAFESLALHIPWALSQFIGWISRMDPRVRSGWLHSSVRTGAAIAPPPRNPCSFACFLIPRSEYYAFRLQFLQLTVWCYFRGAYCRVRRSRLRRVSKPDLAGAAEFDQALLGACVRAIMTEFLARRFSRCIFVDNWIDNCKIVNRIDSC